MTISISMMDYLVRAKRSTKHRFHDKTMLVLVARDPLAVLDKTTSNNDVTASIDTSYRMFQLKPDPTALPHSGSPIETINALLIHLCFPLISNFTE